MGIGLVVLMRGFNDQVGRGAGCASARQRVRVRCTSVRGELGFDMLGFGILVLGVN